MIPDKDWIEVGIYTSSGLTAAQRGCNHGSLCIPGGWDEITNQTLTVNGITF
jgi:hypothetical protein